MSSLHNDLTTWAGKARARGQDRIELTVELADALGELVRAAGAMEQSIPASWHDEETTEFRDALRAAEKQR